MQTLFWVFLATLVGWTFIKDAQRARTLSRNSGEWFIDIGNLVIHLLFLPCLQLCVFLKVFDWLTPQYKNVLSIGPWGSLGLYVLLDYLWYWNHRLLHSYTWIWNLHAVHHSAKQVDVFTSARNSVWSHIFEVYIWFIAGVIFLVNDPQWFMVFVVLGSMSNFWTHTTLTFSRHSKIYLWISKIFITPHEHLWHHSTSHAGTNFGTVFSFWDHVHGTFYAPNDLPEIYGNEYLESAILQLALPVPAFERWYKRRSYPCETSQTFA